VWDALKVIELLRRYTYRLLPWELRRAIIRP
jgi:hypothetical protein